MSKQSGFSLTERHVLWGGAIEVLCLGLAMGDWALAGANAAEAQQSNPGVLDRYDRLASAVGVELLIPRPSLFNGLICGPDDLKEVWVPGRVRRGLDADGVILTDAGDAFGIASADCPTLVLHDPKSGVTVATHAGRDCLYDRGAALSGQPPRRHESVVDSAVAALREHALSSPTDWRAFIACGIGPERFLHAWNDVSRGRQNSRLIVHLMARWTRDCLSGPPWLGQIDLRRLIALQLMRHGLPSWAIGQDATDTFVDVDRSAGGYRWHSHRRDGGPGRNLVVVVRRT